MTETILGTDAEELVEELPSREEYAEAQIEWLEQLINRFERVENHARFEGAEIEKIR